MVDRVAGPRVVFGADDRAVELAFIRMRRRVGRANQQLRSLQTLARRALVGLSFGTGLAVREFAKFERSMVHVKNLMGATDKEFKALEATARKMGATTEHTAVDAANGLRYFALAGFDAKSAIMSLRDTLNLATIGELELGYATDLVTDTMTAFGAGAEETTRYVDAMGKASSISNQSVEQIGLGMQKAAPAARAFSIDIEETTAALGLLANAGLKGEVSGTYFRAMTDSMVKNSEALRKHNIEVYDATGAFRPLVDVLRDFEAALVGQTDKQKESIIATLGEKRAKQALRVVLTQGTGALAAYTREIKNSAGFVENYATELLSTLVGEFKQLVSAMTEAGLGFAEDIAPALIEFIKGLTDLITKFNEADESVRRTTSGWITFALKLSGMTLVAAIVLRGVNVILGALFFLRTAVIAGTFAWSAFWGAATVGLSILIPLLILGFKAIYDNWDGITRAMTTGWIWMSNAVLNNIDRVKIAHAKMTAALLKGLALVAKYTPGMEGTADRIYAAAEKAVSSVAALEAAIEARDKKLRVRVAGGANELTWGRDAQLERGGTRTPDGVDPELAALVTPEDDKEGYTWDGVGDSMTPMGRMHADQIAGEEEARRQKLATAVADFTAYYEEIARVKQVAAEREKEEEERVAAEKKRAEDAERDAARKRLEGDIKESLMRSKRGRKLLNAWQKVQMLRDIALAVTTRAPEAYMTTSAKYPWPLGQILGTLHAAAIVASGAKAKAAAQGFNQGGLVRGFGTGDSVPAVLTPGEEVVTRPVVDALRQLLAQGALGGGGDRERDIVIMIDGDAVARATERSGAGR